MKKIIARADDLGYCEAINLGIYKSIHEGFIKSVGLMSNMKDAEHGYSLIKNENICLGLHVNISAGKPISDPKKITSLINKNGEFHKSAEYKASLTDIKYEEALIEIEAQYFRFLDITGKKPAYMDAHAINSNNFLKALKFVSKKYDLKSNHFPLSKSKLIKIGNSYVNVNSGSQTGLTPFDCLKKIVENENNHIEMIVYHPGFLDAYIMRNSSLNIPRVFELEMLCDPQVKAYLIEKKVMLISHYDL